MVTITLNSHVGADGILTLQVPIKVTNTDVEAVIVVQPVKPEAARAAGGRHDEKQVSETQGEYEVREGTAPPLASLIGAARGGFATPEEADRFVEEVRGERAPSIQMKPLDEVMKGLLALTPGEKAQALRVLALDLAAWPGIEKTPGVAGGEARIVRTRIPVWVLDGYRRAGWSEAQLLENYPTLQAADLVTAWAYTDAHSEEIEQAQRENAEA